MTGRRTVATILLVVLAAAYTLAFIAARTGTFVALNIGQSLDIGGLWGILPAALAVILLIAVVRRAGATYVAGLFAVWFMLAIVEVVTVHPYWGIALVINGAIPLLVLWRDLRSDALG